MFVVKCEGEVIVNGYDGYLCVIVYIVVCLNNFKEYVDKF